MAVHTALSEPLRLTLKRVEAVVNEAIVPLERRFLAEGPTAIADDLEAVRVRVKAEGLWAPHLPKIHGGMGLKLAEFAHLAERMGTSLLGHYAFNCQAPDVGNMELLLHHGSPEQQSRFLKPLARGEVRSCFAMTEPDHAGSNPTQLSTTALADGGDYVINGRKWFATGADGAAFAIVMALTDPRANNPHARASQILVPLDTPGFRVVRQLNVMGKVGSGNFSHAEVAFEDCRVPRANLLGPEHAGFSLAQERLGPGRIHHCMRWIGICQRAFDLMCQRALTRDLAPGKPLVSRQFVQGWIAESRAQIDAARLLVLDAAAQIDSAGAPAAREAVSLIKFYVADVLHAVLDRAIQTHGAYGLMDELPLAFWYRHERAARIYDGADEIHKVAAARQILKRYAQQAG